MALSLFRIFILERANKYLQKLPEIEKAKVLAHIAFMQQGSFENLHSKKLSGVVQELIVKQHRFLFFKKENRLYFVTAFKKQSAKTPKTEIEYAKEIFTLID
jgi:phage-related protein